MAAVRKLILASSLMVVTKQQWWWDRGGGEVTNYGGPEGGPGPTKLHIFFNFSWLWLSVDCTNKPFQTRPMSPCKWESGLPIWCKYCCILGGGGEKFFSLGPEPDLGGHVRNSWMPKVKIRREDRFWTHLHLT